MKKAQRCPHDRLDPGLPVEMPDLARFLIERSKDPPPNKAELPELDRETVTRIPAMVEELARRSVTPETLTRDAATAAPGMRVAYIAGPYRSKTQTGINKNILNARAEAEHWWQKGMFVLCPHANSAGMDGITTDENFIQADLEAMRRLRPDVFVLLPGWQNSEGAKREEALARELGCQIVDSEAELPFP